ncbi:MAG TPA: hypothetical protein VMT52_16840 [Planctomycetota bacterium]|nr:hypothetical protein [Planctomycetota bacterium]
MRKTRPASLIVLLVTCGCAGPGPGTRGSSFVGTLRIHEGAAGKVDALFERALRRHQEKDYFHQKHENEKAARVFEVGDDTQPAEIDRLRENAREAGDALYLWINVGRNPRLAAARPGWVAGMGSHDDWRRDFPSAPRPGPGERIGVFPWTPIWYEAVLEDRREAIVKLLRGKTRGLAGVFLNQVQGAPSACGCGNLQCRWTVDYRMGGGPRRVEGAPAALLVERLEKDLPGVQWIPVWVAECEERDQGTISTGHCGTVPCFSGLCWRESTKELDALAAKADGPLALLATEKLFGRDSASRGAPVSWLGLLVSELKKIPPLYGRAAVPASRLIAVIEGDGASPAERRLLEERALETGVRGVLVLVSPLDESWEPRLVPAAGDRGPDVRHAGH